MRIKKLFILAALVSIFFVGTVISQEIRGIIKPVNVTAGVEDTLLISDLFYSDDYNYEFAENRKIELKYLAASKGIVVKAEPGFEGIALVRFVKENARYYLPVKSEVRQKFKFTFEPEKDYENIYLMGSFNGWNRSELEMKDDNGDGVYSIEIPLSPGKHQYKFFADGEEIIDPKNVNKVPNGLGGFNSVFTVKEDADKPYLHLLESSERNDELTYSFLFDSPVNEKFKYQDLVALINNTKISKEKMRINGDKIKLTFPKASLKGENVIRLAVNGNNAFTNIQTIRLNDGVPAGNGKKFRWYDSVIYSLMIDRFNDGDKELNSPIDNDSLAWKANYMGGDIPGITQKIRDGYFDSLGINTFWISPVYDNPNKAYQEYPEPHRWFSGYHGYWPIHHRKVEEKFGGMEALKEFVKVAHENDMKVLLDFVSNHVHKDHPFFQNHENWFGNLYLPNGERNLRRWDSQRLTTWFEPFLPSIDYINSDAAVEVMTDNAVWWLKETGADGYRHDAVKHVVNRFWRRLKEKMIEEMEIPNNQTVYQIGETFGSYDLVSSYVNNGQLHAQFNFNLYDTSLPTFGSDEGSFAELDKEMHKTFDLYGVNHLMGNIMDSHDKVRFMAYADGDVTMEDGLAVEMGWKNPPEVDHAKSYDKVELYLAYMMSIPGIPIVYYGSEFGMTGAGDPDNRRMMRFGNELSESEEKLLKNTGDLVKLRKQHPALRYGDFLTIKATEDIYAFVRSDFNERILILLNKADKQQKVNLELPDFYTGSYIQDLETSEKVASERGRISMTIDGWTWRMFELK